MMKDNNNISQGGLSGKMSAFTPEPPEVVWEGISDRIGKKKSRRGLIIFLGTAAGLALAITVGVALFFQKPQMEFADNKQESAEQTKSTNTNDALETDAQNVKEDLNIKREVQEENQKEKEFYAEASANRAESKMERKVRQEVQRMMEEPGNAELAVIETTMDPSEPELFIPNNLPHDETTVLDTGKNELFVDEVKGTEHKEEEINEDSLWEMLHTDLTPDQESNDTIDNKGRWSLGASMAPMYSYRDAGSSDLYSLQLANASESGKVSYGAGINVSYKASDKLTIESGLHYSQMGLNIGEYSSFTNNWFSANKMEFASSSRNVVSVANSIGTISSSSEDIVTNSYGGIQNSTDYHMLSPGELKVADAGVQSFSQLFEYFEIPLNVKYKLIDKSFKLQLIGGVSTNLLFNTAVMAKTGLGDVIYGDVTDVRTLNYSGNAGLGFIYDFPGNFSVCLEPRFKYYLNSINDKNLPATRPYAFGIYTGVNYLF